MNIRFPRIQGSVRNEAFEISWHGFEGVDPALLIRVCDEQTEEANICSDIHEVVTITGSFRDVLDKLSFEPVVSECPLDV
jgi:hypothetical protein